MTCDECGESYRGSPGGWSCTHLPTCMAVYRRTAERNKVVEIMAALPEITEKVQAVARLYREAWAVLGPQIKELHANLQTLGIIDPPGRTDPDPGAGDHRPDQD